MIHVTYTCHECGEEIEVEVIINEENDLPERCPKCNAVIPDKAHEDVENAAMEQASDSPDLD